LNPGVASIAPDAIMAPTYLASIPSGFLGIFMVGMLASQISVVEGILNASATVLAKDLWHRRRGRGAYSDRDKLRHGRVMTLVMVALMLVLTTIVQAAGSVVDFLLTTLSIFDSPLFVVAIVYGLKGRRINEAGALAGYGGGALCGALARYYCYLHQMPDYFWWTTVAAVVGAVVITPIVSRFFAPPDAEAVNRVRRSDHGSEGEWYSIIPRSAPGRLAFGGIVLGGLLFFAGIFLAGIGNPQASFVAVTGMIAYFASCCARLLFE
jgi:Na+/proline symporter